MSKKKSSVRRFASSLHATSKKKAFRITSIALVAIFVVIIILGIIREYSIRASKPSDAQLSEAKKVVAQMLESKGDDISRYNISSKLRKIHGDIAMQVVLIGNRTRHSFLIDIKSWDVLVHSEVELYLGSDYREGLEASQALFPED